MVSNESGWCPTIQFNRLYMHLHHSSDDEGYGLGTAQLQEQNELVLVAMKTKPSYSTSLGNKFTPSIRQAWEAAYNFWRPTTIG